MSEETLTVITYQRRAPSELERADTRELLVTEFIEISPTVLQERVNQFLKLLDVIFGGAIQKVGDFRVEELEVSVEISAEGKLGLLGTGVGISGKGGFTIKLRRH